jgi:HTH-type transcriptional regulator/antitoxin HigA
MSTFNPNWRSPPLDTILDVLEERGMAVIEAEYQLGFKLDATLVIDEAKAQKLAEVLGAHASFWLKREAHYREPVRKVREELPYYASAPDVTEI